MRHHSKQLMHLSNIVEDKVLNFDNNITLREDRCSRTREYHLFEIGADNEVAQTATTSYYKGFSVFQANYRLINFILHIFYRILLHIKLELE